MQQFVAKRAIKKRIGLTNPLLKEFLKTIF